MNSKNRRPSNRRKPRTILWRVVQDGREIKRGEHHDMLRWMLALRQVAANVEVELVR